MKKSLLFFITIIHLLSQFFIQNLQSNEHFQTDKIPQVFQKIDQVKNDTESTIGLPKATKQKKSIINFDHRHQSSQKYESSGKKIEQTDKIHLQVDHKNEKKLQKTDRQSLKKVLNQFYLKKNSNSMQKSAIYSHGQILGQRQQNYVQKSLNLLENTLHEKSPQQSKKLRQNFQAKRNLQTQTNLVKNADFSLTDCTNNWCVWNTTNFTNVNVPSWQPYPEIQIGNCGGYSAYPRPQQWAVDLVAINPGCIRQLISNVSSGYYELTYVHATAARTYSWTDSTVFAYINDTQLDESTPNAPDWITKVAPNFTISVDNSSFYLKFCSRMNLTLFGPALAFSSVYKIGDLPPPVPPVNNTNNTVNNTNTTSNTTSNTSNSNSNSTVNNPPQTNNTSTNSNNSFTNLSNSSSENGYQNALPAYQSIYSAVFQDSVLGPLIQVPAIRQIFPSGFKFFINLDHLWLYAYHNRNYSRYLIDIFQGIQNYENTKQNFMEKQIKEYVIDLDWISYKLDQKSHETPQNFYKIEKQSRQFWVNNFKFFIMTMPLSLLIFLLAKKLRSLSLYFKIQDCFNEFAFKSFLIIIFMQGNTQGFSYFLFSELLTLFSQDQFMKIKNIASVLFLLLLISTLLAYPFILRYLQRHDKKKFVYAECKNSFKGSIFFVVQFGFFNILLGAIHLLAQNVPQIQLFLLLLIETGFVVFGIVNLIESKKVLKKNFMFIISLIASFLRVVLIVSMFLYEIQDEQIQVKIEYVQQVSILWYLLCWIISFIYLFIENVIWIYEKILHKIEQSKKVKRNVSFDLKKPKKVNFASIKILQTQENNQKNKIVPLNPIDPNVQETINPFETIKTLKKMKFKQRYIKSTKFQANFVVKTEKKGLKFEDMNSVTTRQMPLIIKEKKVKYIQTARKIRAKFQQQHDENEMLDKKGQYQ